MLFFFEETLCDLFAVCRLGFCVSWFFVTDGIFCRLALCEVNFKISPFFFFSFLSPALFWARKSYQNQPWKNTVSHVVMYVLFPCFEPPVNLLSYGPVFICEDSKCPRKAFHRPSTTTMKPHQNRAGSPRIWGIFQFAHWIYILWHFSDVLAWTVLQILNLGSIWHC